MSRASVIHASLIRATGAARTPDVAEGLQHLDKLCDQAIEQINRVRQHASWFDAADVVHLGTRLMYYVSGIDYSTLSSVGVDWARDTCRMCNRARWEHQQPRKVNTDDEIREECPAC